MTEELPQSTALDEAKPESLSEITNIDPEKWTEEQLDKLVTMLRAAALRHAQKLAEPKKPKSTGAGASSVKNPKGLSVDDLGI